jgi:hypothetical protein
VSNAHFFAQLFVWAPSSHAQPCILSKPATCMLIPLALLRASPTHLRFLVYQVRNSVAITRVRDIARVRETDGREGGSEKEWKRQQLEGMCTSHQMIRVCAPALPRMCVPDPVVCATFSVSACVNKRNNPVVVTFRT